MSLNKKKKKRGKRASDYGDKTPADYDAEKRRVRKLAAKAVKNIDAMKTRSIAMDRKFKHKGESWEK